MLLMKYGNTQQRQGRASPQRSGLQSRAFAKMQHREQSISWILFYATAGVTRKLLPQILTRTPQAKEVLKMCI